MFLALSIMALCSTTTLPFDYWRTRESGLPNVSYLLLRINGYDRSYTEFRESESLTRDSSTGELRECLARNGLPTRLVRCNYEQLDNWTLPALPLMDSTGQFELLLKANASQVVMFHGNTATVDIYSVERFKSNWSGVLLTPARPSWNGYVFPAILGGISAVGLFFSVRLIRNLKTQN